MPHDLKSERLVVRISPRDSARLGRAAASAGLTKSEYVRSLIGEEHLEVLRLDIDPSLLSSLLLEMKRQGNNLNQLAMRANRSDFIDPSEVSAALRSCKASADGVMRLIEGSRPHR